MFDSLAIEAAGKSRRRINHNFHASMEDNPHRFLNVMLNGTYIRPHRHLAPPKSESFVCLEGGLAFFIFDDQGNTTAIHQLNAMGTTIGIDIAPGIYHSILVLEERAVCFEVKPGPYRVTDDKEFAAWAPAEGSPGVQAFLRRLELECTALKR